MKILVITFLIATAAGSAIAQEPAPEAAKIYAEKAKAYGENAKVVAELFATQSLGQQKNSPMSADEVNDSVQTLADGNRIVRSTTGKFYRNSEGRIRREGSGGVGGLFGTNFSFGQGVSISDPAIGQKFLLDSQLKTARIIELGQKQKELAIAGGLLTTAAPTAPEKAKELAEKLNIELKNELKLATPLNIQPLQGFSTTIGGSGQAFAFSNSVGTKYDTRTEELGTRDFEGVSAEGTRRTTIIPAGAIGNERPIEIVYERWFSKELGMVVYSKNIDPRFGEQTYKLTNIVRSEPDPSLFAVPPQYKKLTEPGTVYRVSTATTPKAAKAVTVAYPAAKAVKP